MSGGALLFLGDYYGTLASARELGKRGISVALGDGDRWARTAASRYVSHRANAPPLVDAAAFLKWLISGQHGLDGRVLYPASDELVFLFARHQDELRKRFTLAIPPFDTIAKILNKQRLYEACGKVGVDFPTTYFPRGESELREILAGISVEVILKPKTQIQLRTGAKAAEIAKDQDLVAAFLAFVRDNPFGPELLAYDADIAWPMLQAYHRSAAREIYSLAGFAHPDGREPALRASRKTLQRPRKLGIGLCFEGAPVEPKLAKDVSRLCRELGYFGMFEIEFIEHEGRYLLIDFNPRPYSQMAFEAARDMPLALLHYFLATNDTASFEALWKRAFEFVPRGKHAYTHQTLLSLVIGAQGVSSVVRRRESEHWERWIRDCGANLVDAVRDPDDPKPVWLDAAKHARDFAKHPRSFLRSFMR